MVRSNSIPSGATYPFTNARRYRTVAADGVALILVLAVLALLTVIVVAIFSLATTERSSAGLTLQRTQAELLADAAADSVMTTISNAIVEGSTQPATASRNSPNKSWASEPGRIWIFDLPADDPSNSGPTAAFGLPTRKSVDLFSGLPNADPDNVDLNTPSLSGEYPIAPPAPGNTAANMKVGWINILSDPTKPADKTHPAIGRVAYWTDDESCKVNINTADGSQRSNATWEKVNPDGSTVNALSNIAAMSSSQKYSYGFGTPSEISLAALPGLQYAGTAAAIADYAWQHEFNSAEEITRVKNLGVNPDPLGTSVSAHDELQALRFDITHYNSSPDLNFMGEPRINLLAQPVVATGNTAATARQMLNVGAYQLTESQRGLSSTGYFGAPLDFIYPQPSQITSNVSNTSYFLHTFANTSQKLDSTNRDYYTGLVISNYLKGISLSGRTFAWPQFDLGCSLTGFYGKYTPRQMDSITLQILDVAGKSPMVDQVRTYSMQGLMPYGWLSNQPVLGIGRAPRIDEIWIDATTTSSGVGTYRYPVLSGFKMTTEYYFPKGFMGIPQNQPFDGSTQQWTFYPAYIPAADGSTTTSATLNFYDYPLIAPARGPVGTSRFGSVWADKMITDTDQDGSPAGIDLLGSTHQWDDADQAKAKLYHPYMVKPKNLPTDPDVYSASVIVDFAPPNLKGRTTGILEQNGLLPTDYDRAPGCYYTSTNRYQNILHTGRSFGTVTSLRLKGGLLYSTHFESKAFGYVAPMLAPLDAMMPELLNSYASYMDVDIAKIVESSIPLDIVIPVPGKTQTLIRVADPLVNQLPADWQTLTNPPLSEVTMANPSSVNGASSLLGGRPAIDRYFTDQSVSMNYTAPVDYNADNPGFRPSGGGDPLSIWLPNQDTRIPIQARFPSIGALFAIRTGVCSDISNAIQPVRLQHGTPFRTLAMTPSGAQATNGGQSYPDWALLDLFAVPFLPQKPYMLPGGTPLLPRRLTSGGATVGRMNINNPPVPYPFAQTIPNVTQVPPKRNALKALFYGLLPSNSYSSDTQAKYTLIDAKESAKLAQAVTDYQAGNGPFFMAGQIANVPYVSNYRYANAGGTRNDLVRDTIGTITTRSNVYSIWVVGQTFKKSLLSTDYGKFTPGDTVTSEIRRHYLVERYIDTGKDGVVGSAVQPSAPANPNAFTLANPAGDKVDGTYHPPMSYPLPYRWRVVAVDNFQL